MYADNSPADPSTKDRARMPDYTAPQRDRVALLTVNAQQDFTIQGSPLRSCGVGSAVASMRRLVEGFRDRGMPIFHAVRLYRPDGSNVDNFRREAVEEGLRVLMPGTSGAELIDEIQPKQRVRLDPHRLLTGDPQPVNGKEWAVYKPRWGAFHDTSLDALLRELEINTLVLCGCNYDTSGRATIYEAGARDYRVVLVPDAMTGIGEGAVGDMGRIGVYAMAAETCLDWLDSGSSSSAAA